MPEIKLKAPKQHFTYGAHRFTLGVKEGSEAEQKAVDDKTFEYLMSTGKFELAGKDAEAAKKAGKPLSRSPKDKLWEVGAFTSKDEAILYAKEVHKVDLSRSKSLKQLNGETVALAQGQNPTTKADSKVKISKATAVKEGTEGAITV